MTNTIIENNCYIASNVNIGHDTMIGDHELVVLLVGITGYVTP